LKIEVLPQEDHQVKIIAEFETSQLEEYKIRAAKKLGRNTRIPGFRPGKAPIDILRRVIGEETIHQQAIEDLIDEQYPNILDEAEIKPGSSGSLDEIISTDPPKFSFLVPLEPEVELGNYKDLRLDYNLEAVTEQEITDFLNNMRTSYATAEPVERAAVEGDLVYVKLSGSLTHPTEDEDAQVYPERPAQFIIGTDIIQNRDWPFPGFNDQLIGLSTGDEKTIVHTFPEDDSDETLRGKEVEFKVNVQSVKALHMPELNDDFAQTVGEFENMDALRTAVINQLENSKKDAADDKFFVELLDKLVESSVIKYPSNILDHEVEHMMEHLKEDLTRQGLEMDAYFKMLEMDREKYIEEKARPAARKRLERALVIEEVGKRENIQLGKDDYEEAISTTVDQLKSLPGAQKRKERVSQEVFNSVAASALSRKYNQLILDRLKLIATGQAESIDSQSAEETTDEAVDENPARVGESDTPGEAAEND
jgi:trigger factor